jgi:drug/metabolite transporter (DMT)-like permease
LNCGDGVGILQRIVAKTKTNSAPRHAKWLLIALFGALVASPNGLIIKQTVASVDPFMLNMLRFSLVAAICMPFVWRERKRLNAKNLRVIAGAGLYIAIAVSCFVEGVKLSQASYAAIVLLLTPVILLIYSVKLYGERVSRRAVAGISLAATGAMLLVVLPIAMQGGGVS